jgi:hypothetical protein
MRRDAQEIDEIVAQAKAELNDEHRRAAIEREKQRIRTRAARPLWKRLFPFNITITRSN